MPFKDKEDYNAWRRAWSARAKLEVNQLKSKPCTDCKQTFPHYVMEFDHVPERGKKVRTVAELAGSRSVNAPTFVAELTKCDLVCANCHKIRTYNREQSRIE